MSDIFLTILKLILFIMDDFFYKIFEGMQRLGPGSDAATLKALSMVQLPEENANVLDLGCGTGAGTLVLAKNINGKITALDKYNQYLEEFKLRASKENLTAEIEYSCIDMNKAQFRNSSFDLIWAEGSIYNMGFKKGLDFASKVLKKGGFAMFSDMNWVSDTPPEEAVEFFGKEYPEMMTVAECKELIVESRLTLENCFVLDSDSHMDNYYIPLQNRLEQLKKEHKDDIEKKELLMSFQQEIDIYIKYYEHFSYCFYIMKKS